MKSPGGGWPKKNNKIKDVLAKFNSQERKMYCFMHALFYKDYTWHIHRVVTKGWEQGIFPSFSGFPIIWQLLFNYLRKRSLQSLDFQKLSSLKVTAWRSNVTLQYPVNCKNRNSCFSMTKVSGQVFWSLALIWYQLIYQLKGSEWGFMIALN